MGLFARCGLRRGVKIGRKNLKKGKKSTFFKIFCNIDLQLKLIGAIF